MTCPACAIRAEREHSGAINPGCKVCLAWDIAQGPHAFDSQRDGKLTPRYKAALAACGLTHEDVKNCAERTLI